MKFIGVFHQRRVSYFTNDVAQFYFLAFFDLDGVGKTAEIGCAGRIFDFHHNAPFAVVGDVGYRAVKAGFHRGAFRRFDVDTVMGAPFAQGFRLYQLSVAVGIHDFTAQGHNISAVCVSGGRSALFRAAALLHSRSRLVCGISAALLRSGTL